MSETEQDQKQAQDVDIESPALIRIGTVLVVASLPAFPATTWLALTAGWPAWAIGFPILTALFGLIIAGFGVETPPAGAADTNANADADVDVES